MIERTLGFLNVIISLPALKAPEGDSPGQRPGLPRHVIRGRPEGAPGFCNAAIAGQKSHSSRLQHQEPSTHLGRACSRSTLRVCIGSLTRSRFACNCNQRMARSRSYFIRAKQKSFPISSCHGGQTCDFQMDQDSRSGFREIPLAKRLRSVFDWPVRRG